MEKIYTTKNIDRIRVVQAYLSGQYTRKMAATNLDVSERQITRIVNRYIEEGPESVIHSNTGKVALNNFQILFVIRLFLYIKKNMVKWSKIKFPSFSG